MNYVSLAFSFIEKHLYFSPQEEKIPKEQSKNLKAIYTRLKRSDKI